MTYNSNSGNVNKNVLIDDLNLVQDRNTIFFENDKMIVLSPSIQNESWWFDLLRGNVEKVMNSSKDGLLILRFLDKLLVTSLKKFINLMVQEEFVVKRQQGQDNWKFHIRQKGDSYIVVNQKNSKVEYPIECVTREELLHYVELQCWLDTSVVSENHFKEWLKKNTSLTDKTIGVYISAIRSLRIPLKHFSRSEDELDIYKIFDIEKLNLIQKDEEFLKIDDKWNRAQTAALKYYEKYLSNLGLIKKNVKVIEHEETLNIYNILSHIHTYLQSKGFRYSLENIKNLYLSLRSKPFVIISGISGTGKTKVVQLFAEAIGATEGNGRFKLIPVRPDWSDSSELLGYVDLKGDFKKGPLTEMIEHAEVHSELPHFVLLDEMNLARVEYYFSDVLSVMESRKRDGEDITSSLLVSYKVGDQDRQIYLPNNLYIIGTVNMDETTHPFSKKVLDRANTIEFNEIDLEDFSFLSDLETKESISISNNQIEASYLNIKDVYQKHEALVQRVSSDLSKINQHLQHIKAEVGYRVRDEICFYMAWNEQDTEPLLDENSAFDFCIMQKVLPRILGSGKNVEVTLKGLFEHFTGTSYELGMNVQNISTKYPKSVKKIADMLEGFYDVGFTSFWNA